MQKISLSYVFDLAAQLDTLDRLSVNSLTGSMRLDEVYFPLLFSQGSLERLLRESAFSPYFRVCNPLGERLLGSICELTSEDDVSKIIPIWQVNAVKANYKEFRTALLAELESFNTYLTTNKGGFDMYSLLIKGEVIFPEDLIPKVPEALKDARESARALAFALPTACGFHAFRVTESVLRKYYGYVTGGKAAPKVRSIGVYVNALEKGRFGNPKILSVLKQMASFHRNPLIHPEIVLSTEEAISIIGIARSVSTEMLAVLPVPPLTVTSPQSSLGEAFS